MYDVIIIGGGPGGYRAAQLLADYGFSTAIIEKDEPGGVCLNRGCIPFKTYIKAAGLYREAGRYSKEAVFNGRIDAIDQAALLKKKDRIVAGLRQGLSAGLRNKDIVMIKGKASSVKRVEGGFVIETEADRLEGRYLIIATGSVETKLPSIDVTDSGIKLITSTEMLELEEMPASVAIIGAGAIGLEAARFFNDSGSEVTVIEAASHIGGNIDPDIAAALEKSLTKRGVRFLTDATVTAIQADSLCYKMGNGDTSSIRPDCVLVAVGRRPRIDDEIIAELGVECDRSGIKIDDQCRSSVSGVFACGDITGRLMLAHTAYHQAKVIADTIKGIDNHVDYSRIPRVIYTDPEVISIGLTEQECIDDKIEYRARSLPMTYSGKYYADHGKDGAFAKMIVDDGDRVIGFHMLGSDTAEIALSVEMMIVSGLKLKDLSNLVYAHPSYSEIIGDLAALFA
jgi:dihydrolipoamide dehydrogenase